MRAAAGRIVEDARSPSRYLGAPVAPAWRPERPLSGRRAPAHRRDGRRRVLVRARRRRARPVRARADRARRTPRICLLPTASGDPEDADRPLLRRSSTARACEPSHVSLFRLGHAGVDLREHLLAQDLIYVGGGSLLNLLAIWRAHGLDAILREAWERGVVLCGLSAPGRCAGSSTGSRRRRAADPGRGLGFLRGCNSVHWSSQPGRAARLPPGDRRRACPRGYGVDDGAALVFEGRRLLEVVEARGASRAPGGSSSTRRRGRPRPPLDVRLLEPPEDADRAAARRRRSGAARGAPRVPSRAAARAPGRLRVRVAGL